MVRGEDLSAPGGSQVFVWGWERAAPDDPDTSVLLLRYCVLGYCYSGTRYSDTATAYFVLLGKGQGSSRVAPDVSTPTGIEASPKRASFGERVPPFKGLSRGQSR